MAATPTAHWLEYVDWANGILAEPFEVVDGNVVVPHRPGCGLSWDEDAVARHLIAAGAGPREWPPASKAGAPHLRSVIPPLWPVTRPGMTLWARPGQHSHYQGAPLPTASRLRRRRTSAGQ